MLPKSAALLTALEMQFVANDLDSQEGVLCFSTIMRSLIQQALHSNGCSATVGKFFLILPRVQTSHSLTFICLGPRSFFSGGMAFETEDDLVGELKSWFANLDLDFFRVDIYLLLSR
ncbi:hypothetical protein ElyMa_000892700 [Elysia marginata]|uniref:Uncharacterized protein n=1 Tax=Elysia marginata TaxID=1093978 RepID=A0AAV4H5C8_9GAST|nr:hypothetical protein ElyMa_000892700 [Elysia marginata]